MRHRIFSYIDVEWISLGLVIGVYLAWFILLNLAANSSIIWYAPLLAYVVTLQTSLQHEFSHGHPTRLQWLNDALVFLPLVLWLPFSSYKQSHLQHHRVEHLSDPLDDPESYYFSPQQWSDMPRFFHRLHHFNHSFSGRMLVGPLIAITKAFSSELSDIKKQGLSVFIRLIPHIFGLLLVFSLLTWLDISIWVYLLLVVWPATSLMLLRSYHEHRPGADNDRSTALIETNPLLSLLFLNNNLHVVHHQKPALPWYQIPAVYRQQREQLLKQNGGYFVKGYTQLILKYAFRPRDNPVYDL